MRSQAALFINRPPQHRLLGSIERGGRAGIRAGDRQGYSWMQ